MKYLLTGGGTGGHVYPALAIADGIRTREKGAEFLYVGLKNKLESWIVPGRGYPIKFVRSRPFPRSSDLISYLAFCIVLGLGVAKSLFILLKFRPHVIIGTGGYGSAPILFAYAVLSKIALSRAKVFVYEPNVHPGLLNQIVGGLAHRVGVAFEQAGRWFDMKRVAVVGYPVRQELYHLDCNEAREGLGIGAEKVVVLVFGGSGGARVINEAIVEALPLLQRNRDILVLHITGRYTGGDYNAVEATKAHLSQRGIAESSDNYRRLDYMENIQEAYAAADFVVCRGGAGTLTEICVCELPAIIVPLAGAADDHQASNAREMEKRGAAEVVYQESFWDEGEIHTRVSGTRLACQIIELADDKERRLRMSRAAGRMTFKGSLAAILQELEGLVEGQRPAPLNLDFPQRPEELPANPNALLMHIINYLDEIGGPQALEPRERAYLLYKADRLLVSRAWYEIPLGQRNVGIKLIGYLGYKEQLQLLLSILQDRRRVGAWQRFFGGDYCHNGILRRNVIEYGLRLLQIASPEVKESLLDVLRTDPYFEVRAMAAKILGELFDPDERIENALVAALGDRASLVVIQVIRALGKIAAQRRVLEQLKKFYLHPNWQFRQEVVSTIKQLLERGILLPQDVAVDVEQILASAPYFIPEFPLKERLQELAELVRPCNSEAS